VDEYAKLLMPLLGVAVGVVLTWFTNRLNDRRKAETERRGALRTAYADWLTAASMLKHQIAALAIFVEDVPQARPEYTELLGETKQVLSSIRDCLNCLHRVYLLDHERLRREAIRLITKNFEGLYEGLEMQAKHFRGHIELRESTAGLRAQIVNSNHSDERKRELQEEMARVEKDCEIHHEKCASNTKRHARMFHDQARQLDTNIETILKVLGGAV
jgi:hypothetical protein